MQKEIKTGIGCLIDIFCRRMIGKFWGYTFVMGGSVKFNDNDRSDYRLFARGICLPHFDIAFVLIRNLSMNDCCSSGAIAAPKKCKCPVNGIAYAEVSVQTILHHIKHPWQWTKKDQGYYFCDDPGCDVVYFGEDGSLISRQDVRGMIGIKDASADGLICYCFGVSRADALSDPALKEYVTRQTKDGLCSCKTSNPSGRCCLKDFPRNDKK